MRVPVGRIQLHCTDEGNGVPVILLHGFPLSSEIWSATVDKLIDDFRVIVPDLRGHGLSDKPEGSYSMDTLADDVVALANHFGIDRFVLGGHSMGGYATLRVVDRHPDRLLGLIFVDSRAEADSDEGKAKRIGPINKIRTEGKHAFLDDFLPNVVGPTTKERNPSVLEHIRQIASYVPDHVLAACLKGLMERPDSRELLLRVRVPALVVVGEEDTLTPVASAEVLADGIADSELVVVPGAGHTPSLESPAAVAKAIHAFLRRITI
ncbi:MAG: alpha/beta fold hydrolase [Armatimonadetes bacterium]|nr:alpha/beta fold hydrolase [Armatimonadota bacterium]